MTPKILEGALLWEGAGGTCQHKREKYLRRHARVDVASQRGSERTNDETGSARRAQAAEAFVHPGLAPDRSGAEGGHPL